VSCACPGGAQGVQKCLPSGTGYGSCDCSGVGGQGGYDPCGDDFCDAATETCRSCEADCGACAPCDEAPSCDGAMIAPSGIAHKAELDIQLHVMSAAQAGRELLERQIHRNDLGMRALAAALAPEQPNEHAFVRKLREVLGRFPAETERFRAQLEAVGLEASVYSRANPFTEPSPLMPMGDEFPGGTPECGAPLLRVAIQRIIDHNTVSCTGGDNIYCLVESEAQAGAEIRVTPLAQSLGDGDEHLYSNEAGVFWGQQGPRTPGSDLLVTYNCFENTNTDNWQSLADSLGQAAGDVGDIYDGAYGWVFPVTEGVSGIISAALAMSDGDKLWINAQQQIALDMQLELTNGAWWSLRKTGDVCVFGSWDWEVIVRVWGCAQYGTL